MQDTFVRATRALAGYQGGSPRAWLCAIARTTFLDDYRRRAKHSTEELVDAPVSDPDVTEQQTIQAVLVSLPETQRSALVLRDQLGLSYEDVAAALRKSLPATKVIIHRARAAFRRAYEQEQ
jgi:RNA polymerase sigma-70 factor (ECF subfamily)